MRDNIAAFTATESVLPAYVSINRLPDGRVEVAVRGAPTRIDGVRVCGATCHPGAEECNGYCRGAAERPAAHSFLREGNTAGVIMSFAEWSAVLGAAARDAHRPS